MLRSKFSSGGDARGCCDCPFARKSSAKASEDSFIIVDNQHRAQRPFTHGTLPSARSVTLARERVKRQDLRCQATDPTTQLTNADVIKGTQSDVHGLHSSLQSSSDTMLSHAAFRYALRHDN